MYKLFIRPLLFLLDPEVAHNLVLNFFSKAAFLYPLIRFIYSPKRKKAVSVNDLNFKNPLGLAAGFDKNGIAIRFWEAVGFSHVEVGTVTPLPQPGNPKPRIFRLKKDHALINRLGFNNKGADEIRRNILEAKKNLGRDFIVGVNIGKNKDTPHGKAFEDYKICLEKLYDAADYFTINISSPNTEGLRDLHQKEKLHHLLSEIQNLNRKLSQEKSLSLKNIFLKISPDLSFEDLKDAYDAACEKEITGITAANTTVSREVSEDINESGGLSGKPLKEKADKILKQLKELNNGNKLILIGVGGVFDKSCYTDKISSGASLVQIYTGFIYEGPSIIKKIIN